MFNSNEILKEEIDSVLADIRALYEASGKRVTGRFSEDLKATYTPNKAVIEGQVYTAGRAAGEMPPIQNIIEWVEAKNIAAAASKEASSIAWAIAKKIAREGTNKENARDFYTEVLTPQRIDSIILKVSQFHVTQFIESITTELKIIQTTF